MRVEQTRTSKISVRTTEESLNATNRQRENITAYIVYFFFLLVKKSLTFSCKMGKKSRLPKYQV